MAKNALVFLIFLFLSLVVTWPLIIHLNTLILDRNDGLLITWIINWFSHKMSLKGNIFYPYHGTLAFSDFHLASTLLAFPFLWVFKEPLLAFNINLIFGFTLTGFSTYLLVKYLTKNEPVGFFAGVLLTFSTIHLNYMAHLQLFHLWLIIFTILFLFQNKFILFVISFIFAVSNSPLNFYFLLFFVALFRKNIHWFLIGAILSSPFLIPYLRVSETFKYTRPITDAIHFSMQFPDLANISIYSRLSNLAPQIPNSTPGYFGTVFLASIFLVIRKLKLDIWLIGAGLSFIFSLGPALHFMRNTVHLGPLPAIPLPYALFYYLLPGFSGFRTPSRWILITALCLTIVIAIRFAQKMTWRWAVIISLLVLVEVNFPFHYLEVSKPPPEQVWLKDNYIGAPIIQFPIYGWFDGDKIGVETLREYYSTLHWHPMFNGYSGFSPKKWEEKVKWLQNEFPSPQTVNYLESLKIKLVLIPSDWDFLCCQDRLKLVATFPDTKIYELH